MTLKTSLAPAAQLPQILPVLLESLSISRGQIVLDQLQSVVRNGRDQDIVLVTSSSGASQPDPVAAVIALHEHFDSSARSTTLSDSATVLLAGPCHQQPREFDSRDLATLSETLDQALSDRGVRFVQWATDVSNETTAQTRWCDRLGFQQVAQLQYLSGMLPNHPESDHVGEELRFVALNWDDDHSVSEFASLVQRTYAETLDCPRLAEFRSAAQTLSAYQRSASFAPKLWFTIEDNQQQQPIGCLILAQHTPASDTAAASITAVASNDAVGVAPSLNSAPKRETVLELVYMGLISEARGQGRGRGLVRKAMNIAIDGGASRWILAVDEANTPARNIYESVGLRQMMCESVWVKALGSSQPS